MLPLLPLLSFTDEYEHAMAGQFMLKGLLPYRDYFHQHSPLLLFTGLFGHIIPGVEPVFMLRILTLLFSVGVWTVLLCGTKKQFHWAIFTTMIGTALASPKLLFHMNLVDIVISYTLLGFIVLATHFFVYNSPRPKVLILLYCGVFFVCFWSSIASIIPLGILGILFSFILIKKHAFPNIQNTAKYFSLFVALNLIFPLFYLVIGSFRAFWWDVFTYNTSFYYASYLTETDTQERFGPLYQIASKFTEHLLQSTTTFFTDTQVLIRSIIGIRNLEVLSYENINSYISIIFIEYGRFFESFPNILFLTIFIVLFCLLLKKKFMIAFVLFLVYISMFFRNNEVFHWSPLFIVVLFSLSLLLYYVRTQKNKILTVILYLTIFMLFWNLGLSYIVLILEQFPYIAKQDAVISRTINKKYPNGGGMIIIDANMMYFIQTSMIPTCYYQGYPAWIQMAPVIKETVYSCIAQKKPDVVLVPRIEIQEDEKIMEIIRENYLQDEIQPEVYIRK